MAENETSNAAAIQEQMLRLAHVYTGKENGAKVRATPVKGNVSVEIDLSAAAQAEGIDAMYAKVSGGAVPDDMSKTATSMKVTFPDSRRAADRLANLIHDAAIERETDFLMKARAEATERLTYVMGEKAAGHALQKIDRKITPRPNTPLEDLASGPMRDWVNDIAPSNGSYFSRG